MIKIYNENDLLSKHLLKIKPLIDLSIDNFKTKHIRLNTNIIAIFDFLKSYNSYILKAKPYQLKRLISIVEYKIDSNFMYMTATKTDLKMLTVIELQTLSIPLGLNQGNLNKEDFINIIDTSINYNNNLCPYIKKLKIEKIKILIKKVFENFYKSKWDTIEDYTRYHFVRKLGLKTCPYCNRNYIYAYKNGNIRAEIDHFYPKSIYPYLAMSFYNLIPSCQTCNHVKSAKDSYKDDLKSPYEISDNDFKFTYDFIEASNNLNDKNIKIRFKDYLEKHLDYFKLDKLYLKHSDIVLELYHKLTTEYSQEYVNGLNLIDGVTFTDEDIYRLITCHYKNVEDFHKRPLSKLVKDIFIELSQKGEIKVIL